MTIGVVTRLRRNPHRLFAEIKRAQGDVAHVRFGRARLFLISHPDDIQRVLVTEERDFARLNVPVKRWLSGARQEQPGVTLGPGGDPELRLAFRRAIQPAYSRTRIDSYWPEFLRTAEQATARWREGETIDLTQEIEQLTLELVTRAVFGRPLDMPIDKLVARTHACLGLRRYASSRGYRIADKLRLRRNLRAMSAYDDLAGVMRTELDRRRAEEKDADVLSQLLRVDEKRGLGDDQLALEALGQLFVGSEPVGSLASWTLYLLAGHKATLQDVRAETDKNRADPTQLTYLRAVLSEALRLHPPFTLIGRQARVDRELSGKPVRAGDPVFVCPFHVHRDERWWPDAARFNPERWLDESGGDRPRLAYLPFGAGPRQCVGEHLAWRGAAAVVAIVVSGWDPTPLGPAPGPTALRPAGVHVRIHRRH